jgi:hypothetical protein
MENQKDFTHLKAGDVIFMQVYTLGGNMLRKVKVDKVTPTGKIKIGTSTFNNVDGNCSKFQYNAPSLVLINDNTNLEYQRQNVLAFLKNVDFKIYSTENLFDLYKIIKNLKPKE